MYRSTATKAWQFLILTLVVIGFMVELIKAPYSIIVPLLIVAVVYYLYKFPPRWLIRMSYTSRPILQPKKSGKGKSQKKNRKSFRVIDGNKKETL